MHGPTLSATQSTPTYRGELYKAAYDRMLGNTTRCAKIVNFLSNMILLTVFVVSCTGSATLFPNGIMGWILVGLGGGYMALKLLGGNLKNRSVDLISSALIAAIIVIFGSLGAASLLTDLQMGCALIGVIVAYALSSSCMMIYAKQREERQYIKLQQL
jgi:hypothetical protein